MFYVSGEPHLQNVTFQQIWLKEIGHYNHKTLETIAVSPPNTSENSCEGHECHVLVMCLITKEDLSAGSQNYFFSTYKRLKI